jgi:hypothetical protein
MADYSKKTKSDNKHLELGTSARFVYIDGSVITPVVVSTTGVSLLRVILNTNGATLNLKSGSRQVGTIATDAPEGPFPYGIYCENGLTYQASGAIDATLVIG